MAEHKSKKQQTELCAIKNLHGNGNNWKYEERAYTMDIFKKPIK